MYSFKSRISNVWNYPKTIKTTLITGLMIYLFMLIGSIIIANFFGYRIVSHTISKLGTISSTSLPLMFDSACIIGGIITMGLYCSLSRRVRLSFQNKEEELFDYKLHRYSTIIGILGSLGIIFVGIFSLDRKGPQGIYHSVSSLIAFGVFSIALFTFGIVIYRCNSKMPKILGINGLIPLITLILNCILPSPLLEWILLFSILTTLIPLFYWISFR